MSFTMQVIVEGHRESEWRRAGVPEADIRTSAQTGMDARDVHYLRSLSLKRWLFIVRCPKRTARPWHGVLPPKGISVKQKSGTSGTVVMRQIRWNADHTAFTVVNDDPRLFVSDYDLMSVWRIGEAGKWRKTFMSAANGAPRGKWTHDAHEVVLEMNRGLVSRIQHGCQDDFHSSSNPGVDQQKDHFAAFADGVTTYLPDVKTCAGFYAKKGLVWPYDERGKYVGPVSTR